MIAHSLILHYLIFNQCGCFRFNVSHITVYLQSLSLLHTYLITYFWIHYAIRIVRVTLIHLVHEGVIYSAGTKEDTNGRETDRSERTTSATNFVHFEAGWTWESTRCRCRFEILRKCFITAYACF